MIQAFEERLFERLSLNHHCIALHCVLPPQTTDLLELTTDIYMHILLVVC